MLPSVRKPRRIGGAPFAAASPRSKEQHSASAPAAPVDSPRPAPPAKKVPKALQAPKSAREGRERGPGDRSAREGAQLRAHSQDVGREQTPCTERAEQYIKYLTGQEVPVPPTLARDAARDWALVQELDAMDYFAKETDKRKHERQLRLKNVSELQEQKEMRNREKQEGVNMARKWRAEAEVDAVNYKRELEEKKAKNFELQKRFNEDRRQQLEAVRSRQRQDWEEERRVDREMAAAAEAARKREEDAEIMRRNKQRDAAKEMATEAKLARDRKLKEKVAEAENDVAMAREQQELLDKQDRERAAQVASIKAKQEKMLKAYEAGVGGELERKAMEDERRAQRHQEAKLAKERALQETKERKLNEMKEAGKAAVAQQLQEHEAKRRQQKEDAARYAEELRQQAMEAERKEAESKERKKQAMDANAEFLRKQMRERNEKAAAFGISKDQMDEVERRINREKLMRAKDPDRPDGLQLLLKKKRMEYRLLKDK